MSRMWTYLATVKGVLVREAGRADWVHSMNFSNAKAIHIFLACKVMGIFKELCVGGACNDETITLL